MKKIILVVTIIAIGFIQNSFSQSTQLLPLYYGIKDALVVDNSAAAATKAGEFVKEFAVNDVSKLSRADRDALQRMQLIFLKAKTSNISGNTLLLSLII
ncbi:MAG TPA: hypothetical protein DIT07_16045 [Sphingobacteriaceae bacterium]|nr:hypothetical protein [Sphingobacteriaceae bacterium]